MSVQNRLLRSSILLTVFYLAVGFTIYFFTTGAHINYWANKLGLQIGDVSGFESLSFLIDMIAFRMEDLYPWFVIASVVSIVLVSGSVVLMHATRKYRRIGTAWKSVYVTLSDFPSPISWSGKMGQIRIDGLDLKGPYRSLMNELISFAMQHKDHFIGFGHGDSGLLKHTVSVIESSLAVEGMHKLLPIAAAAHDLGKVRTFEKDSEGEWVRLSPFHDIESAKILKSMPSWDLLPEPDRRSLYFAVKYEHHPESMPVSIYTCSQDILDDARKLQGQLRIIDGLTSCNEAESFIETNTDSIESSVLGKVIEFISVAKFISEVDTNYDHAAGFTIDGDTLFIIEHSLRSFLIDELPESITTPLGLGFKKPNGLSEGTLTVLKYLDGVGSLVRVAECSQGRTFEVDMACPLWDVRVGEIQYKALIALKITEGFVFRMPNRCKYECKVLGPYRLKNAKVIGSKKDSGVTTEDGIKSSESKSSKVIQMKSRMVKIPPGAGNNEKKIDDSVADKAFMPDNDMPPDLY